MWSRVNRVYAEFEGWQTPIQRARKWKDLPEKARQYLRALAELTGARLSIASVGPARNQTIIL